MIKLSIMVLALLLTSCSSVREYGGGAYDRALNESIRFTCNDASVGAIKRRFGHTDLEMRRWVEFCFGDNVPLVVPPDLHVQP